MMPHLPHVMTLMLLTSGAGAPAPAASAVPTTDADLVALVNDVRFEDCGSPSDAPPLEPDAALDGVAALFADGQSLQQALAARGYATEQAAGLRLDAVRLDSRRIAQHLGERFCSRLGDPELQRVAAVRRGESLWLVIAAAGTAAEAVAPRKPAATPRAATPREPEMDDDVDLLALVNEARARPRQCGSKRFAAAPPLRWAEPLDVASRGHAEDMAQRGYFDHVTPEGRKPTDRLASTGYEWTLTGENIAKGDMTPREAVQGWLASAGHCANIMDPRFTEMGFAIADGEGKGEVYWVQTFAAPREEPEAR